MEYIENKDTSTAAHPPGWWLRYVDDTHLKHKKDELESFTEHMNCNRRKMNSSRLQNTSIPSIHT